MIFTGCLWALCTGTAQAHDFWLEPDAFTPDENESIALSLRFGVGFKGDSLPYIDALFDDFSLVNQSGRSSIQSVQGNDPAAIISATTGAQLLGYQSVPQFVELDAEKFDKYLEEEGIEYIRALRESRGQSNSSAPENFIRCAKALIQTGPVNDAIYSEQLGYALELIPQANPYQLETGDELEFLLLYQDEPIDGLQLQALSKANPESVQKIRTDKNGKATVTIDQPGAWLIKAVLMVPIAERQQIIEGERPALWQSYWASYVFELPAS